MTIRRAACALLVLSVPLLLAAGCRGGRDEARLARGGQAYLAQCAVCHGIHGEGDGPLAASIAAEGRTAPAVLDPARVGSLGPSGLRHAIGSGAHRRPGSPMPLWGSHLGPEWTDRITEYVAAMPGTGTPGRAMVDRYLAEPGGTPVSGRRVYVTYCSSCHGPEGGGDRFFAPELEPTLKPARLRGEVLAALDDAELSKLISMGGAHALDAVTMPGWLYTISPGDRQALVGYLRTLAGSVERD
jgi:mono/diheme cytochrome c family protein